MQSTPSWFGRKYLTEEEGDVTLTVLNEGSWPAKYHVCKTCKGSRARMKEGRGRFLAVGGISSFHLLKDDKVVFQISISRPDKKETIRSFASWNYITVPSDYTGLILFAPGTFQLRFSTYATAFWRAWVLLYLLKLCFIILDSVLGSLGLLYRVCDFCSLVVRSLVFSPVHFLKYFFVVCYSNLAAL